MDWDEAATQGSKVNGTKEGWRQVAFILVSGTSSLFTLPFHDIIDVKVKSLLCQYSNILSTVFFHTLVTGLSTTLNHLQLDELLLIK